VLGAGFKAYDSGDDIDIDDTPKMIRPSLIRPRLQARCLRPAPPGEAEGRRGAAGPGGLLRAAALCVRNGLIRVLVLPEEDETKAPAAAGAEICLA
jgi:hypothetical protein